MVAGFADAAAQTPGLIRGRRKFLAAAEPAGFSPLRAINRARMETPDATDWATDMEIGWARLDRGAEAISMFSSGN
jgi:hypothetical protein